MSSEHNPVGTSSDDLAGEHYRAVRHTIDENLRVAIESTRLTRTYGEESATRAAEIGMGDIYLRSSMDVKDRADTAVKALIEARARLEDLVVALIRQGA